MPEEKDEAQQLRDEVEALRQQVQQQSETNQNLSRQLQQPAPVQPVAPKPERPSPQKLQEMVDNGQISEATRTDILMQHAKEDAAAEVRAEMEKRFQGMQHEQALDAQIASYTERVPDVLTEGSETRNRVQKEFDYLVSLGEPGDKATEVKALRAALGPADAIRERTRSRRSTHAEAGGVGDGVHSAPEKGDGVPAPLQNNDRLRYHYESMIKDGSYSGWDDPALQTELKYASGWKPERRGVLN
jgi:hypothetical protein